MNAAKNIIGLILSGVIIGLGLLLVNGNTQLVSLGPAAAWFVVFLGVLTASSTYTGMRLLGFGVIALGLLMWVRSADVIAIPLLRWSVGLGLIAFGLMSIVAILGAAKKSSQL